MGYIIARPSDETSAPAFWEIRLGARLGISPIALGVLISIGLAASNLGIHWVFGSPLLDASQPFGLQDWARSSLLIAVLLGYVLGAFGFVSKAHDQEILALGLVEASDIEARRMPKNTIIRGRWAGAAGVASGLALVEVVQRTQGFDPSAVELLFTWQFGPFMVSTLLTSWIVGRILFIGTQRSPLDDMIDGPVDLLNLRPLYAVGRSAVTTSVAFIIGISLLAPWVFIPGYGPTFLSFIAAALLIPIFVLLVPAYAAHRRLREAKRAELDRVDREVQHQRDDAMAGDTTAQARMSFLLGYRAHIDGLPDWPFESRLFTRFGLYLLIPLASWLASALVERLVDATLD
jgi:hypothetical protein